MSVVYVNNVTRKDGRNEIEVSIPNPVTDSRLYAYLDLNRANEFLEELQDAIFWLEELEADEAAAEREEWRQEVENSWK